LVEEYNQNNEEKNNWYSRKNDSPY
jgi:hypothetical protein